MVSLDAGKYVYNSTERQKTYSRLPSSLYFYDYSSTIENTHFDTTEIIDHDIQEELSDTDIDENDAAFYNGVVFDVSDVIDDVIAYDIDDDDNDVNEVDVIIQLVST